MTVSVQCLPIQCVSDLPGRLGERLIAEVVQALELPDGNSVVDRLRTWADLADDDTLGPQLLELLLLRPPIPAGCTALVTRMTTASPPWADHEIPEDRVSLWIAHALLHSLLPSRFPQPSLSLLTLSVNPAPAASSWARAPALRRSLTHWIDAVAQQGQVQVTPSFIDEVWQCDALLEQDDKLTVRLWVPHHSCLMQLQPPVAWSLSTQ